MKLKDFISSFSLKKIYLRSIIIFIGFGFIVLIIGAFFYTSSDYFYNKAEVVYSANLTGIYVYETPELTSKIISKIPFREKFYLIDKDTWNDEWKKIEYEKVFGYIYQKEFSFETPSNLVYVDNLEGIKFYEKPNAPKPIRILPHKTKLEILDVLDYGALSLPNQETENDFFHQVLREEIWLHVKQDSQEGYIFLDESIKIKPKVHYFFVVHSKGLNLYSEPKTDSKILINLPKNTIGEILEAIPEVEKHGNLKGYWFKTEYKSKVGWGFSGYIITSTDPSYFETKDYVYDEEIFLNFLSSTQVVNNYSPKKIDFKKSKIYSLHNYKILEVNYNFPIDDCSVTTNARVVFQNQRLKNFYSNTNYYEEKIISMGEPFPENVYTEFNACHCCCGEIGNNLYFLFEDKIQYINFNLSNSPGKCFYGPNEGFSYYQENRIDKEKKIIYSLLKLPVCKDLEMNESFSVEEMEPISFSHSLFTVLKVENNYLNIEKYYDEDIPSQYEKEWNKLK